MFKDKKDTTVWKIPPKRIPSDDCVITVDGEEFHVHEGEWVEIIRIETFRQLIALVDIRMLVHSVVGGDALANLCDEIAQRLVAWNWTGNDGKPLPQPCQNRKLIQSLSSEEVLWLSSAIQGETKAERKNASGLSEEKS